MGDSKSKARSAHAWELAQRQHGVLSRRDLLGLGFSPKGIKHRVQVGRLHPILRGIYAVGRPELNREGRWMAALLACGEGAFLSHRSAAALYGIGEERDGLVEASIRRRGEHHRSGITVRSRPSLPSHDVGTFAGIPVTSPVRTMLDLATELDAKALERAVNEADKRDRVDSELLRVAVDSYAGQPGARALRTLLDRQTFRLSDTELEVLFRPIAAAAGLPTPLTKEMVNGFEVDFYWPDLGLVVETDGWRYHRTASAQTRDALRDQTHTAAGLTPLRFSHYQVKHEPRHVRDVLSRTATNLRPG
jgi:very-short-patch-repair endonuclease